MRRRAWRMAWPDCCRWEISSTAARAMGMVSTERTSASLSSRVMAGLRSKTSRGNVTTDEWELQTRAELGSGSVSAYPTYQDQSSKATLKNWIGGLTPSPTTGVRVGGRRNRVSMTTLPSQSPYRGLRYPSDYI